MCLGSPQPKGFALPVPIGAEAGNQPAGLYQRTPQQVGNPMAMAPQPTATPAAPAQPTNAQDDYWNQFNPQDGSGLGAYDQPF